MNTKTFFGKFNFDREKFTDEVGKTFGKVKEVITPENVAAGINSISSKIEKAYEVFMEEMKKTRTMEINNRQDANRQILKELSEIVENHPDLRFNQMLYIMNVIRNDMDTFNEESLTTLKHIQAYKEDYHKKASKFEKEKKTTANKCKRRSCHNCHSKKNTKE